MCLSASTLSGFPFRGGRPPPRAVCSTRRRLWSQHIERISLPFLRYWRRPTVFHVNRCDNHPAQPIEPGEPATRKTENAKWTMEIVENGNWDTAPASVAPIDAFRTAEGDLLLQLFKCYSCETLSVRLRSRSQQAIRVKILD